MSITLGRRAQHNILRPSGAPRCSVVNTRQLSMERLSQELTLRIIEHIWIVRSYVLNLRETKRSFAASGLFYTKTHLEHILKAQIYTCLRVNAGVWIEDVNVWSLENVPEHLVIPESDDTPAAVKQHNFYMRARHKYLQQFPLDISELSTNHRTDEFVFEGGLPWLEVVQNNPTPERRKQGAVAWRYYHRALADGIRITMNKTTTCYKCGRGVCTSTIFRRLPFEGWSHEIERAQRRTVCNTGCGRWSCEHREDHDEKRVR